MQQALPLIAVALSNLIPVAFWAWLYISKDPSREPRTLLLFAFVVGGIATLPVMLLNSYLGSLGAEMFPHQLLFMVMPVLIAATVEEICKHCGVMFVMNQDALAQNEVLDGIIYAVVTALGFAFVENTVYTWLAFWGAGALTWDVVSIYMLRGMLSMFAHTIFSGFFGYYYALAFIEPKLIAQENKRQKLSLKTLAASSKLSSLSFQATRTVWTSRHDPQPISRVMSFRLLLEGLWLAAILHMLYNLFLTWPPFGQNVFIVVTPYLFVLGAVLMWIIAGVKQKR